jgi:hypothetical protein
VTQPAAERSLAPAGAHAGEMRVAARAIIGMDERRERELSTLVVGKAEHRLDGGTRDDARALGLDHTRQHAREREKSLGGVLGDAGEV